MSPCSLPYPTLYGPTNSTLYGPTAYLTLYGPILYAPTNSSRGFFFLAQGLVLKTQGVELVEK